MDWSKIENIIFAAVAGALAVFMLVLIFVFMAKGKRARTGADVALRVFASILLIVFAALVVCSVATGLTGGFRIEADGEKASIIIGDSATKLPLPVIFYTLSTAIGQSICVALFVLDLIVIVADGLLARKVKKVVSPEEKKRNAELERIKKLGDAAVKKSSAAADSSVTEKTPEQKTPEADSKEKPEEEDFDWRVDAAPQKKAAEFVGLSDSADDDFDSFDSEPEEADETEEKEAPEQEEPAGYTDDSEPEEDGAYEGNADEEHEEADEYAEDAEEPDEYAADKEQSEESADEPVDTDEPEPYEDESQEEYGGAAEEEAEGETPWYAMGGEEPAADEPEESAAADTEETYEEAGEEPEAEEQAQTLDDTYYDDGYGDIEPDRDIYIPKMRTIKREKKEPVKRPAAKKPAAKKPAAKKPAADTAAKKPAAKKPTAKPAAKKPTVKPAAQKSAKPDPKKLPMTRRYVILDRSNAVNIFSNYLKERDKADKDKLESSINTIILK